MTDFSTDFHGTERFRIERQLGSGSFGIVYQAWDRFRNRRVALKLLQRVSGDSLYRFKQEFRSLAGIRHRNLASLYELLSDGKQWFLTMELIEGKELLEYLARQELNRAFASHSRTPTLRLEDDGAAERVRLGETQIDGDFLSSAYLRDLRVSLRQLVDGISAVHAAGKLHRDIKPSNILVTDHARVVLLDFGLVLKINPSEFDETNSLVGTPGYMSPEQSSGQTLTQASDWYSLGVILFQALTGSLPFVGNFYEIIAAQHSREAPRPSDLLAGIPKDLDDLCFQLLQRETSARAGEADIRKVLGGNDFTYWLPSFRSTTLLPGHRFIGRSRFLESLDEALTAVKQGQQRVVALNGPSGSGKTALVNQFFDTLRLRESVRIIAGKCYERESVPYNAVDDIIDSLARFLKKAKADEVRAVVPANIAPLARLFPVLEDCEVIGRSIPLDPLQPAELRRKALDALRALFHNLSRQRPIIIFIDDVHWGDRESAELINALTAEPDAPPLLLILAHTTEYSSNSAFLSRLAERPQMVELSLSTLTHDESVELVESLYDRAVDAEEVRTLIEESGRNAFLLDELARHTRNNTDDGSKRITLAQVFHDRLSRLPSEARWLLQVIAIAGQPLDSLVALEAAGLGTDDLEMLSLLRESRLIRSRLFGDKEEVEIFHNRIRDVVYTELSPASVAKVHDRLAQALKDSPDVDPETMMLHLEAAGRSDEAATYAVIAAEKALEALAFDHALRLYRFAIAIAPEKLDREIEMRLATLS